MTVLIQLTSAGIDSGPFDLYSNVDGYTVAFASSIAKSVLLAGYTSTAVPTSTTIIRVTSLGTCTNYTDITIQSSTTTTSTSSTTSTTTTATPTTTTTTTANIDPAESTLIFSNYIGGYSPDAKFNFILSNPIPSTTITVDGATIQAWTSVSCSDVYDASDVATVIIVAGAGTGQANGSGFDCTSINNYKRINSLTVNGNSVVNGSVITIGGTSVTISINTACEAMICSI